MLSQSPSSNYLRRRKPWLLPVFLFYCSWWVTRHLNPTDQLESAAPLPSFSTCWGRGRIQKRRGFDFVLEEASNSKSCQDCFSYKPKAQLRKGTLETGTSMRARCSPAGGAVAAACAGCGSAAGRAGLTLPSPGDSRAASAHRTAFGLIHETLLLKESTCNFFLYFHTKDNSSTEESDSKVHKILKCTYLVAGLCKELQRASSLYWDYLEYISSGVACTVLRLLCCKSWHAV